MIWIGRVKPPWREAIILFQLHLCKSVCLIEDLVGWSLLDSASFRGTGSAPICLEKSGAGSYCYLKEPFGSNRALTDTSISSMCMLVKNLMNRR